ncbi:MAG TPA: hypothetical protein VIS06_02535 [Mycobacteriales bacterium]
MSDQTTLLVNFWYAHPVGHAIEALRICLGYHRADPTVRVSLVLNSATPTELANLCPFVSTTYRVTHPFFDAANCPEVPLEHVPRDWDWVVDDGRRAEPAQLAAFGGFAGYHTAADSHLRARLGRGLTGTPPPAYLPHQRLTLDLPADARVRASRLLAGASVRIAVLLGGGRTPEFYPSATSWELVLRALLAQHPGALVCLVGKLRRDGCTATGYSRAGFDRLRRAVPQHRRSMRTATGRGRTRPA